MKYNVNEGIFAKIAGGIGSSVTVIRISGEFEIILKICDAFNINVAKLKPNYTFLSAIYKDDELLDKALITYFKAPYSFTGECCLEIALHGSSFIFDEFCSKLFLIGLRMASNGEFSYRAFLNGKMDLVEAEGMASLINSTTKLQHISAKRQFLGESSAIFIKIRGLILEVLAFLESVIDFSDEDLPNDLIFQLEEKVNSVQNIIEGFLSNTSLLSLQEGLKLVIIGRPNVGKSSLFNILCGREKAIVSKHAGTTRDILEERLVIEGIPLILYDTAGIHATENEVEIEGIKRAKKTLEKSDIKILMKALEDKESFEELAAEFVIKKDKNTICVLNKIDEISTDANEMETNVLKISALNEIGINALKSEIQNLLKTNFLPLVETGLIATERQKQMLGATLTHLRRFNLKKPIELAGEDLKLASKQLEEIIGKIDIEDILGSIFAKFCIGK